MKDGNEKFAARQARSDKQLNDHIRSLPSVPNQPVLSTVLSSSAPPSQTLSPEEISPITSENTHDFIARSARESNSSLTCKSNSSAHKETSTNTVSQSSSTDDNQTQLNHQSSANSSAHLVIFCDALIPFIRFSDRVAARR